MLIMISISILVHNSLTLEWGNDRIAYIFNAKNIQIQSNRMSRNTGSMSNSLAKFKAISIPN